MITRTLSADTVLRGGTVITMTDPHSQGEPLAVGIRDDRVLALVPETQASSMIGPATTIIDVSGKTLLPGFVDSHVHFTQTGLGDLGSHAYGVTSRGELMQIIADAARATAPGAGVLIHGVHLAGLDQRLTRSELDAIDSTRPIMVVEVGAHGCVLNGAAIEQVHLPSSTPGIGADGVFIAQANTRARYRFYSSVVSDEARVGALHRAASMAAAVGITTVHALEGGSLKDGRGWLPQRDVEIHLQEQQRLSIETVIYFQSTDVPQAVSWSLPRIGGCLWVDGDYDEHTAALLHPYADCPNCSGSLYFSDEELNDFVERAHDARLQISMHAIGDAAIEQLLNAYERALRKSPRADHRHRIEHFGLPTSAHIRKAAALGVALGMQPNFALITGPLPARDATPTGLVAYLGYDRWRRRHPYREILDAGLLVSGGSDADPRPMGPLIGLQALIAHPEAERRLSPYEALQLYTVNGARIAFQEADKGTLTVGKRADIVVLGENPMTTKPDRIAEIPVEWTFARGKPVYQRGH
jgi:predicted amidohydrolase YtcJ